MLWCGWTLSLAPVHHRLSYVTWTAGKQSVEAAMEVDAPQLSVDTINGAALEMTQR